MTIPTYTFATGCDTSYGLVGDGTNLYFSNGNNIIYKVDSFGTVTTISSDTAVYNIAIDPSKMYLYFPSDGSYIYKLNIATQEKTLFYTDVDAPSGNIGVVGCDSAGNVYYTLVNSDRNIYKLTTSAVKSTYVDLTSYTTGNNQIKQLGFDSYGNLYAVNHITNSIIKVDTSLTITGDFITTPGETLSIAFDSTNNIFVADPITNSIYKYNNSGTPIAVPYITDLNIPVGLSFDNPGNLYIGNVGNGNIVVARLAPNIICFNERTKLLCSIGGKDEYVKIEDIAVGTLVKTLKSGYKKVALIGSRKAYNPDDSDLEPNLENLYICRPSNYPELTEDLILTGAHSILVDTLTDEQRKRSEELMKRVFVTEGKYRLISCLDPRATRYTVQGNYTLWHLALEHEDKYMNYGIFANGLLVETASKRMMAELSGMNLK